MRVSEIAMLYPNCVKENECSGVGERKCDCACACACVHLSE